MKIFISTIVSALLLVSLSACGGSSVGSMSQNQSQPHNTSKDTNNVSSQKADNTSNSNSKSSTTKNSSTINHSSTSSNNDGTTNGDKQSSNNNQTNVADTITNAVVRATLDVESKKINTTADYHSLTMTQSGQKVGFEIVPTSDNQNDFKSGTIKEKNNNGVDNVTLFQYKVNDNNQLLLIETTPVANVLVYQTTIGKSRTHISSGKDAINYLKKQLKMTSDSDIVFNVTGGILKTDNIGTYYTIQLVSKSILKKGGSGIVALYYVYQDGSYMLHS